MKKDLSTVFSTRQYMISRDFELFYYCDHDLKEVATHSHDYYEFYFFLEGDASIEINQVATKLSHGDMILIPPNVPHRPIIHSQMGNYSRFVFWISEAYCNHLLQLSPEYVLLMQHASVQKDYIFHFDEVYFRSIQAKLIRLLDEMHSDRFGRAAQIPLYVNDLILHLNRLFYESQHKRESNSNTLLYRQIMDYIGEHLDEDLSLEQLSSKFFVSKYYIAHLFKDSLGISIHQYITAKRLEACKDALHCMPIKDAYQGFGFHDYSVFYRAFKKEFGMSPREYVDTYTINPDKE